MSRQSGQTYDRHGLPKFEDLKIPCPPMKPPKAPDPSAMSQTPSGDGDPAEQAGPQTFQYPPSVAAKNAKIIQECLDLATRCVRRFWWSNITSLLFGVALGALVTWGLMR